MQLVGTAALIVLVVVLVGVVVVVVVVATVAKDNMYIMAKNIKLQY